MAAATQNRFGERQPSELVPYTGASGYRYFKNTLIIKDGSAARIIPLTVGAGASNARFIGVANNEVNLTAGLGASQKILDVWKCGEFTFNANGTGVSADIGKVAYGVDDQTVGVSSGLNSMPVGEIVGLPTTSSFRVRIDNAINLPFIAYGASSVGAQN